MTNHWGRRRVMGSDGKKRWRLSVCVLGGLKCGVKGFGLFMKSLREIVSTCVASS